MSTAVPLILWIASVARARISAFSRQSSDERPACAITSRSAAIDMLPTSSTSNTLGAMRSASASASRPGSFSQHDSSGVPAAVAHGGGFGSRPGESFTHRTSSGGGGDSPDSPLAAHSAPPVSRRFQRRGSEPASCITTASATAPRLRRTGLTPMSDSDEGDDSDDDGGSMLRRGGRRRREDDDVFVRRGNVVRPPSSMPATRRSVLANVMDD
mmetsp:Transcript_51043/g.135081  ORF Transcript_51043/g.135081 Transcript_51043/m.135081 type:complete len:213 (+) Transcript_51043:251-889(+)